MQKPDRADDPAWWKPHLALLLLWHNLFNFARPGSAGQPAAHMPWDYRGTTIGEPTTIRCAAVPGIGVDREQSGVGESHVTGAGGAEVGAWSAEHGGTFTRTRVPRARIRCRRSIHRSQAVLGESVSVTFCGACCAGEPVAADLVVITEWGSVYGTMPRR